MNTAGSPFRKRERTEKKIVERRMHKTVISWTAHGHLSGRYAPAPEPGSDLLYALLGAGFPASCFFLSRIIKTKRRLHIIALCFTARRGQAFLLQARDRRSEKNCKSTLQSHSGVSSCRETARTIMLGVHPYSRFLGGCRRHGPREIFQLFAARSLNCSTNISGISFHTTTCRPRTWQEEEKTGN